MNIGKRDLIQSMALLVSNRHIGQFRKDTEMPYIAHLWRVADRVAHYCLNTEGDYFGLTKEELICAALGHDLLEDTKTTFDEIESFFGKRVALVILECSREPYYESKEQKWNFLCSFDKKSRASKVIKIADRLENVLDYHRTPNKQSYASTYALQAYPLCRAYMAEENHYSIILQDIHALDKIVHETYPHVSLFGNRFKDLAHALVT